MIFFYLLVSVMPFTRHPLWSEFVGDLTMVKVVGVLCAAYAVFYLLVRRSSPSLFGTWQARWFVLFALLAIVSFLVKGLPQPSETSPFMSYASFLLFFIIVLIVVDTPQRLRWVLLVAIGSVAYTSLHVLREWQKYGGMSVGYRPGWIAGDPNYFSLSAILCLSVALYLLRARQPRWERLLCFWSVILILLALTLGSSRGALLGITAGAFLFAWHSSHRLRSLATICGLLLPLMVISPSSPLDRLLRPDRSDQESADTRIILWKAGLRMVAEYPWTGIGTGNFKPMVSRFGAEGVDHIAHNTYIEIAAEMGIPGLLLFLGILYSTFTALEKLRRIPLTDEDSHFLRQTACGMQTGLLAYSVSIFFVSAQAQKLFWLFVFLSIILSSLVTAKDRETRQPDRLVVSRESYV